MTACPMPAARASQQTDPPRASSAVSDTISPAVEQQLRRRLRGWARGYLRMPEQEIADAYQTAWGKVLAAERSNKPVRNLEHALRWGLANAWREECRRRHRHPISALDEEALRGHPAASQPDACEQAEQREVARYLSSLAQIVGELPWQIVYLRRAAGLSPAEVCARLGISERRYRTEHARAVKTICTSLAEDLAARECVSRRPALQRVALDETSAAERESVAGHVRHCSSCRRVLLAMKANAPREKAPPGAGPIATTMSQALRYESAGPRRSDQRNGARHEPLGGDQRQPRRWAVGPGVLA